MSKEEKKGYKTGVRRFPRLPAKHLISYEYFNDETTEDVEGLGVSQNLSVGGILIEIDKQVRIGATLFLEIALREHVIKATGRIAHVNKMAEGAYDVGVSFSQIRQDDLEFMTAYFKEKGVTINFSNE